MTDTDKLTLLRAGTLPKDAAEWVERIIAERDQARDDALDEAARAARGQYVSISMYDPESCFYGCDLSPDRSDWGRGIQRGREQAAAAIRGLKASK